jgi:hypothetical protein
MQGGGGTQNRSVLEYVRILGGPPTPQMGARSFFSSLLVLLDHILEGPRGGAAGSNVRQQSGHESSWARRICCSSRRTWASVQ